MKALLVLLILLSFASCSFKSDDGGGDGSGGSNEGESNQRETNENESNENSANDRRVIDLDSDLLKDRFEKENGLDPFIADIPIVKAKFLQNYSIKAVFEDESTFEIDTEIERYHPDFQYRTGNRFILENSLTSAARIGKFSGVSSGNIEKRDFSWIKFPKIDPFFFQNKFIEYRTINKKLKGINIDFSNSFNLERGGFYNEIKDLKINFYYYSYRDEDFKLLHTEVINSTIQAGVFEDVSISLENVPTELLEDTYFGHGEFIYSEIEDFFIPKLGRTYRVVLAAENAPT